jgi:hypothetical protein
LEQAFIPDETRAKFIRRRLLTHALVVAKLHLGRLPNYTRTLEPARALAAETLTLERTLSDLVNQVRPPVQTVAADVGRL